jgi:salicylate hydroxylase
MSSSPPAFKALNIAIIGAGLGGLSTALSLRRSGHTITIYERSSFAGEIGAGLSTASNGSKWLLAWGVDVEKAKPVIVKRLIMRKWGSGEVVQEAPMGDYGEKFGFVRTVSPVCTFILKGWAMS